MSIIRQSADFPPDVLNGAITIGNFDGVHRGHATIIAKLVQRAREVGGPAVVVTFEPHPARLLRPEASPPPLTWVERKAELLALLQVDRVVALPTSMELLSLGARDFFDKIIRGQLQAKALVEGPNFFFGKGREGNVELLREFAEDASMTLDVVQPLAVGEQLVSSSRIRKLIADGQVDQANAMLTQPYRIRGMVTHGAGRGRTLGFPTANLDAVDTLLPAHGVYAGGACIDGEHWPAAINLGPNPTFAEHATKVEVHLVGLQQPLYGSVLEVDFYERLRDIQSFSGPDALREQLDEDVARTCEIAQQRRGAFHTL